MTHRPNRSTTATGASVYDTRPACPARFHDSVSATRKAGCVCPLARERRRVYFKRQQFGRLDPAYTDATGTRRRLQALIATGWPIRELARQMGWAGNPGLLLYGERQQVHKHTAALVADVYDRLWDIPGPSLRSRRAAQRAGYAPPSAWDDDTIDDPAATPDLGAPVDELPDEEAVRRALAGKARFAQLQPADRVEAYRRLVGAGAGPGTVCRRLGISAATLRALAAAADADRERAAA
jgi:hypothetical protein